tara:strand:- start:728 stop:997 length:270 start_codon:yes stop_codon:yes gene_type:complete
MIGFIGVAAKFVADFLSNIINGVVTKWMQMRESRKRGEAEAKNVGHEENARRAAKAFKIISQPIKTGGDLIAGLRNRTNRMRDNGSSNT